MRTFFYYILIVSQLLITVGQVKAQHDTQIAFLEQKLKEPTSITNQIVLLNELSGLYLPILPEKSLELAKVALEKSKEAKNSFYISESYRNIGRAELKRGWNSFAWKNFELAYENDKRSKNVPSEISSLNAMGDFYAKLKKYDKAITQYLVVHDMLSKQGATNKLNEQQEKLGATYIKAGDRFKGMQYLMRAKEYYEENNDSLGLARLCNQIGEVYQYLGNPDKGIAYFSKSYNIYQGLQLPEFQFLPLINLGSIYMEEGNLEMAQKSFFQNLATQKTLGKVDHVGVCYQKLGELFQTTGNYAGAVQYFDSALYISKNSADVEKHVQLLSQLGLLFEQMERFEESESKFLRAVALADSIHNIQFLSQQFLRLSDLYETLGRFEQSLRCNRLASLYLDSIHLQEHENNILAMKTNLLVEQKQRENDLLTIDNQVKSKKIKDNQEQWILFVIMVMALVSLFVLLAMFFRQKVKNRIRQRTHVELYDEAVKKFQGAETKYAAVVEQSYDIIFILHGEQITFANKRAIRISGYSEQELYTKDFASFVHPEDYEMNNDRITSPLKVGEARSFTLRLIDRYGNVFTFELIFRKVLMGADEVVVGSGRDLTERIEAEEALRKSDLLNESLVENSPSGILYVNQNGDVEKVNQAAISILGLEKEPATISLKYYDLFREPDSNVTANIQKCFEKGLVISEECKYKKENQGSVFLSYSLAPVENPEGGVNSVIINFSDISERKKIEQALMILEERYKLAFEGTELGLWDWDMPSGNMIFNDQFYNILDAKENSVIRNHAALLNLVHPDDRQLVEQQLDDHKNGNRESYIAEYRIITNEGYWKWVLDHGKVVVRNDVGFPLRMVGTTRDITIRKTAEDRLLHSEKKYRSLIENMQDGVFIIVENRIVFGNLALAQITGYGTSELEGMPYTQFLNDSDAEIIREKYNQRLKNQDAFISYESKLMQKDRQTKVYVNLSLGVIDFEGKKAIHGTVKDITEKKESEKILKQSELNLREANATKDKFFSIIAHDLKNPFNAIMGFAQLLHEEYDDFADADKKRFVKNIFEASENTFKLVENLLTWSRAQTGKIPFRGENIDLFDIATETVSILKPNAESKNIEIRSKVLPDFKVYGDLNMLTTVVRNLISNAIKFTPSGGHVDLSAVKKEGLVEFCVADDGIGISKENQKKLFQFGEQFKREGTANERGTGLGLILCREFIDNHKGKIWIESEANKGSRFYFTVPVAKTT